MAMKQKKIKIFEVVLTYNIEEEDAIKALDKAIGFAPIKPIAVHTEPTEVEFEDDDD